MDEVHYDDALWAYTIRAFEEWKNRDVNRWNDPIIDRLFCWNVTFYVTVRVTVFTVVYNPALLL